MKAMSQQLSDLSDRSKKTEELVSAARERNLGQLTAQQAKLTTSIAEAKQTISAKRDAEEEKMDVRLHEVRASVSARFDSLRTRTSDRREAMTIDRANQRADRAEQDASDSVAFALYVLDEAEWAVVDAVLARAEANDLDGKR